MLETLWLDNLPWWGWGILSVPGLLWIFWSAKKLSEVSPAKELPNVVSTEVLEFKSQQRKDRLKFLDRNGLWYVWILSVAISMILGRCTSNIPSE